MKYLIMIFVAIVMTSCTIVPDVDFNYDHKMNFTKGMSKENVSDIIDTNYIAYRGDKLRYIFFPSDQKVDSYNLKLKQNPEKNVDVFITSKFEFPKTYYIFSFIDDKLYYWGYPDEFSRSSNILLNDIGKKVLEILRTHYPQQSDF